VTLQSFLKLLLIGNFRRKPTFAILPARLYLTPEYRSFPIFDEIIGTCHSFPAPKCGS